LQNEMLTVFPHLLMAGDAKMVRQKEKIYGDSLLGFGGHNEQVGWSAWKLISKTANLDNLNGNNYLE
jgi:hypothetical protein